MSNEVILNLSFDNQTVTDLTGKWTLDGTPNATYEQIDGRDGYSIVEGSLGRCIVLNAVDQSARYDEYTVDFDMFVKSTYTSDYYVYYVFYLWSKKDPNIVGSFRGKIGEVLSIAPEIGYSSPVGVTRYSPIGRWVHITITSGPTSKNNLYHTAVYVDGVKLTERTDSGSSGGNPFGISQRIIPCARDPGSFLMPNGPGVCLNTFKVVTGIHMPDQNPAISLFNLSRVFNNFCTWLKGQLSTVALTGSYNDLSNKPTISTVNDATLTIQQNGVTVDTFTANSSTDKTVNIQCVDLSSNQTIDGNKTFSGNFSVNRPSPRLQTKSTTYSSETSSGMTIGEIAFLSNSGAFSAWIVNQLRDDLTTRLCFRVFPKGSGGYKGFVFDDTCTLYPENSQSALGTSSNKWKTLNGLNPGALSLPVPSGSSINVDTTNWDLTCQNKLMGSFTPTADGWLMLQVNNSGSNEVNLWIIGGGDFKINNKSTINTANNDNFNMITIPVRKGTQYNIYGNTSEYVAGRSIGYCRFMPCQGNV